MKTIKCLSCGKTHDGYFGSGLYCNRSCANRRKWNEKQKKAVSERQNGVLKRNKLTIDKFKNKILKWKEKEMSYSDMAKLLKSPLSSLRGLLKSTGMYDIEYGIRIMRKTEVNPFVKNFSQSSSMVRRHIHRYNLIEHKCSVCGIDTWMGKPLALELDHVDGNRHNNQLSNLRFLCPNCHSQTPTFRSKNDKHQRKISDEKFVEALKNSKSINDACRKLQIPAVVTHYKRALRLMEKYNMVLEALK